MMKNIRYILVVLLTVTAMTACEDLEVQNLNDPYTGGMSSYALFLLIVAFIQAKGGSIAIANVPIGQLLIDFLHTYSTFETDKYGIRINT
jgi:DNA polymerase sigma